MLVFWELTSFTSFLLIGYQPEAPKARRSAQQGLLVTVAGGLAMLGGIILLGEAAGSYRISEIVSQGPALAAHPFAPAVIVLIAAGAFAKSHPDPAARLAAQRDGGADAGLGLSALGDHGEGSASTW